MIARAIGCSRADGKEPKSRYAGAKSQRGLKIRTNFLVEHPLGGGNILLTSRDPTYTSLKKYLAEALPARTVVDAHVPILVEDGTASYVLPEPATPAQVVAALLRDIGLNATALPRASPDVIAPDGDSWWHR